MICSVLGFALGAETNAASISFIADKQSVKIGDDVSVSLIVDSQNASINAAQGIIHFLPSVLQLSSVDRSSSVFNFWVEDPNISNNVGTVSFTGGTANGASGNKLNVLTMKFKATGAGSSEINFSDGTVAANDGQGTNVLSNINSATIKVLGAITSTSAQAPAADTAAVVAAPIAVPQKIERPVVPTGSLPVKPTVEVNAYPDETRWYNKSANAVVFWNVPKDVTAVAVSIDKNSNGVPAKFEKELFDGRDFGPLEEGVWYAHARFRNDIGSGPVATHKISLDTTPPLPFKIVSNYGNESDDPSPELNFSTHDSFSGIDYYFVIIDGQQPVRNETGSLKLVPQEPGKHIVKVIAFDKAGNTAEALLDINILPLASPEITFVTQPFYSGSGANLQVSGSALPGKMVLLSVVKIKNGSVAANGTARTDDNGNFSFSFEENLNNGSYKIVARTQDERGALSFPAEFSPVAVKSEPVLIIGALELSSAGLITWLLIILLASFAGGYYFYKFRKQRSERKMAIAERDLLNISDLLKKGLETLKRDDDSEDGIKKSRTLEELEENVAKIGKYIKKEVEDIRK